MLKLNVGLSKKVGQENYGSKGASVNMELELDSGIITEPERLRERIRQLFSLAKAAVEEELNGNSQVASSSATNGNGHTNGHSNGNGHTNASGRQRDATRQATVSQVRAIHAIADRQRLDLPALLQERFGIYAAAELSITEASALIDELKGVANGHGGQR